MRYVRCLDKLDMTDTIIKICVNLSNLCYLCAIKHNDKLSFSPWIRLETVCGDFDCFYLVRNLGLGGKSLSLSDSKM